MRRLTLLAVVLAIAAGACAWTATPVLLSFYAGLFATPGPTAAADALVVLSGNPETRVWHAVQLYRAGYAPCIVLTDTRLPNPAVQRLIPSEEEQARAVLAATVPDAPVLLAASCGTGAVSTYDEAYDLRRLCRQRGWRRIIIVTDRHHTRRARYAFRKVLRSIDVQVEAAGAPNDIFDETCWWRSDRGLSAYVTEPFKCIAYLLTDRNMAGIENY